MANCDLGYEPLSMQEIERLLPVVISDIKHNDPARRERTNANIRRGLYQYVIREAYSETRFRHEETVEGGRGGMFIKGYVRDVWSYLDEAYDLIHDIDFEAQYPDLIATVQ